MHVIVVGSYVTVTVQVDPGASESMHVLLEMAAVPGEGVIVPDTCAATDAAPTFNARSPSLTSVAATSYAASGMTA